MLRRYIEGDRAMGLIWMVTATGSRASHIGDDEMKLLSISRIAVLAMAVCLTHAADAVEAGQPDWHFTSTDGRSGFWFVDTASIHVSGPFKRAWIGYHREPEGLNSREVDFSHILAEFDCSGRRQRYLHIRTFYERGKLVGATDVQQAFQYIAPDTSAMQALLTVCNPESQWPTGVQQIGYMSPAEWSKKRIADYFGWREVSEIDPTLSAADAAAASAMEAADQAMDAAFDMMTDIEKQKIADENAARVAKGLPSK